MSEFLSPGAYFETVDASVRGIEALRTDVAAMVGIAERGPLDEPIAVESWGQFRARFGGFLPNAYLAYAAKGFFENQGRRLWVVRVAATGLSTGAPHLQVDRGWSEVESTDGFAPGAVATLTQGFVRRNHLIREVDTLRRRLVWEPPLGPGIDPALEIEIGTGAATADTLVRGADGNHTLRIAAATEALLDVGARAGNPPAREPRRRCDPGAWGNELSVSFTLSTPAAANTAPVPQPLDRHQSAVASTVGFDAGALVRIARPESADSTYRVVSSVDRAAGRLAWDEEIPLGFATGAGNPPLSLEVVEIGLTVRRADRVVEVFSGLSLIPGHPRHIDTALAASHFIQRVGLPPGTVESVGWPGRLPDPAQGRLMLAGGRDGIAALTAIRFQGRRFEPSEGDIEASGLAAVESVDEVALIAIPDLMIQPQPPRTFAPLPVPEPDPCRRDGEPEPLPRSGGSWRFAERAPRFTRDDVFAVQQAIVEQCERLRDHFAILDPPRFSNSDEQLDSGEVQAWRARFDTAFAALYYPWLRVHDPLTPTTQLVRDLPPSGHVAGVFARTDLAVGVHKAPANEELRWAQGVVSATDSAEHEVLNPAGVCAIRALDGRGLRIYGARTMSSDTTWRYVNVRRLVSMIEEAVDESLQWAVFEPNDFALRQTISLTISTFLAALWRQGALAGETAADAFFVKCDAENNPQEVIDAGRLIADVGIAPAVPAEFVVFRLGRTAESFEVMEPRGGR